MISDSHFTRRDFVLASAAGAGTLLLPAHTLLAADIPKDNPTADLKLEWTLSLIHI